MMELTGEIPGLLRRGSPGRWLRMTDDVREGVCCFAPLRPTLLLFCHDPCREPAAPDPADVTLDTSDPTGRLHARLWLLEQGHDVGNEDRAEVLAWSVLSVSRGGKPLAGVAGPWSPWGKYVGCSRCFRPMPGGLDRVVATLGDYCVWGVSASGVTISCVSDTGEGGQAAADAALLRLGWALTNPDGTLTLPPLPGAK